MENLRQWDRRRDRRRRDRAGDRCRPPPGPSSSHSGPPAPQRGWPPARTRRPARSTAWTRESLVGPGGRPSPENSRHKPCSPARGRPPARVAPRSRARTDQANQAGRPQVSELLGRELGVEHLGQHCVGRRQRLLAPALADLAEIRELGDSVQDRPDHASHLRIGRERGDCSRLTHAGHCSRVGSATRVSSLRGRVADPPRRVRPCA